MKIICFFLLFATIAGLQNVKAQTAASDSAHTAGMATHDAHSFRLNGNNHKKFMTEHFPASSDYFKPTARYVSDAALLNDSTYVKAFRLAAFNKTLHQKNHSSGHILLIGGAITAAVIIIGLFVAGPHTKNTERVWDKSWNAGEEYF